MLLAAEGYSIAEIVRCAAWGCPNAPGPARSYKGRCSGGGKSPRGGILHADARTCSRSLCRD